MLFALPPSPAHIRNSSCSLPCQLCMTDDKSIFNSSLNDQLQMQTYKHLLSVEEWSSLCSVCEDVWSKATISLCMSPCVSRSLSQGLPGPGHYEVGYPGRPLNHKPPPFFSSSPRRPKQQERPQTGCDVGRHQTAYPSSITHLLFTRSHSSFCITASH